MRRVLFAGPTLRPADAPHHAGVEWLPPVGADDVLDLGFAAGDRVAIVDGYYWHRLAVRHKEIIELLERGVAVLGAASMGALRAVELAPFGMVGVGDVVRRFRSGELDGDDEVAVAHLPAERDYLPTSVALVNLRATLEGLVGAGRVGADLAADVVAAAKRLCFADRQLPRIVADVLPSGVERDELAGLLAAGWRDVKKQDALAVLDALVDPAAPAPAPRPASAPTVYLHHWLDGARTSRTTERDVLDFCAFFAADWPGVRRAALAADGTGVGERLLRGEVATGRIDAGALDAGVYDEWLTPPERALPAPRRAELVFSRTARGAPTVPLRGPVRRHLEAAGWWPGLCEVTGRWNDALRTARAAGTLVPPSDEVTLAWFRRRWQADDLWLAAADRGLLGPEYVVGAGARYCWYDRRHGQPALTVAQLADSTATPRYSWAAAR